MGEVPMKHSQQKSTDMSASITIQTRSYKDLIKEVYIDPIRSVTLVDDSYPTLEELLQGQDKKDRNGLMDAILSCRSQPKAWLVDVHDGAGLDVLNKANQHFKRLHQSDLMILDYNLDGDAGGNEKACNVLRSLASNDYFNLVIIYTQCSEQQLDERVMEIAKTLTFKDSKFESLNINEQTHSALDAIDEDIVDELLKEMDLPLFLVLYQEPATENWHSMIESTRLGKLLIDKFPAQAADLSVQIIKGLIERKAGSFIKSMSPDDLGKVEFKVGLDNWIRANTLFITVVSKKVASSELPNKLLIALENSDPSPHRLLMTKIRNTLDEKGIAVERYILDKRFMQAGWLNEMLNANNEEHHWKLKGTVAHHWEELASQVNNDVQSYASDLFTSILGQENKNVGSVIKRFTSVDISNPVQMAILKQEWNSYICSKEVDGHHLMTGHIFQLTSQDNTIEYWVCLTPICDLVPRETNNTWGGQSTLDCNLIPFKAVKLIEEKHDDGLKAATKNEHIFIGSGKELKCYKYSKSSNASPTWNQFFAHNNGKFDSNHKITLSCISFSQDDDIDDGIKTTAIRHEAKLVTQLRYEYALHLLQKLGGSLSRIGLDFVSHEKPKANKTH